MGLEKNNQFEKRQEMLSIGPGIFISCLIIQHFPLFSLENPICFPCVEKATSGAAPEAERRFRNLYL
jgi:hypothetical protein